MSLGKIKIITWLTNFVGVLKGFTAMYLELSFVQLLLLFKNDGTI